MKISCLRDGIFPFVKPNESILSDDAKTIQNIVTFYVKFLFFPSVYGLQN